MKPITLIHPFQVTEGQEQEFFNAWKRVDKYMKEQKGFIETKLHRALDQQSLKAFSFVNIALWENAEAFRAAVNNDKFMSLAKNVLAFSCGPGLYEIFDE